ncbi:MAG: LuxR C-terminal-related transcriptional regulator [Spongiibacteraceae bacterium]
MPVRKKIQIINTKVLPPQKRGKQLARHNEQQLLQLINDARLCSVVAPPGYGKTNVLSRSFRHLSSLGHVVAWLSLDPQDNHFYRFLSYMLASFKQANLIHEATGVLLEAQSEDQGDHVLASLIDLLSDSDSDFYFLLDDFHYINDRQVNNFVRRLIAYAPSNFHLVIGSRQRLEGGFYRDVPQGQYVEIARSQLQLSLADTQYFFKECCELDLAPAVVERWHRDAEGWVFPLKLASISMRQRPGFASLEALHSEVSISEYLSDELIEGMPKPLANFLLAISVPDIFCLDSCAYIAGVNAPAEFIAQMQSQHLFIERLSGEGEWYQLHAFFRSYLQTRLKQQSPGLFLRLHRKSREWFEKHNMPGHAIRHCIEVGDNAELATLLEASCYDLLVSGQYMELVQWSRLLSEDDIRTRPKLSFALAFVHILMNQFADGQRLLATLNENSKARLQLGEFSDGLPVLQALERIFQDDVEGALACSEAWVNSVSSSSNAPGVLLVTACNIVTYCHLHRGDFAAALKVQVAWKALPQTEVPAFGVIYSHCLEALVYMHAGDIAAAEQGLAKAAEVASAKLGQFSVYTSFAPAFQAELYYQRGDMRFLLEQVLPCLDNIGQIGIIDSMIYAIPTTASALYSEGRFAEANELLDKTEATAQANQWPRLSLACLQQRLRHAVEVRSTIDRQLVQAKLEEIDAARESLALSPLGLFHLELIKAESRAVSGQYAEAAAIAEAMVIALEGKGFIYRAFLLRVRLAFFYAAAGKSQLASDTLGQCLDFAAPLQFVQVFLDSTYIYPDLWSEHRRGAANVDHRQFVDDLLGRLRSSQASKSGQAQSVRAELEISLSDRERETLELLGQGLTNKHIARSLGIGQETVKWHIKNIFGKFEVNTRVNAVQKARRLGYIS